MVVNLSKKILMFINPLTFVLHPIATFGMVASYESFITFVFVHFVNLCLRYRSSVTGIFPLLNQLQGLMFIRYPVVYAVNLTTRWMGFHHQGNKSYLQVEVVLMCYLGRPCIPSCMA